MFPFTREEIDGTLASRFERIAAAQPDALAIADGAVSWSYGELLAESGHYRDGFAKLEADKAVALVFSHGAQAIIAVMGAVRAGVPVIPIDPQAPPEALEESLLNCQLVVTESDLADWCRNNIRTLPLCIGAEGLSAVDGLGQGQEQRQGPVAEPGSACMIYLTSGTTGRAKGAIRTQRALCRNIWLLPTFHGYGPEDRQAHLLSFAHCGSVPVIFGSLVTGGSLDIFHLRDTSTAAFADALCQRQITLLHVTPSLLRELIDILASKEQDWQPRAIFVAGEKLYPEDLEKMREKLGWECPVVNRLGSSEAGIISEWQIDPEVLEPGCTVPVGYGLEERDLMIVDEEGEPLPAGEIGEIIVTGDYLATGYWQQPDLTAERFSSVPLPQSPGRQRLATGDLGCLREDGLLEFWGRMDSMVKIRGYRIELAMVETGLRSLEGVTEATVVVRKGSRDEDFLVGYVQPTRDSLVTEHQLRADLFRHLPETMIPRRLVLVERFQHTAGGKIDHRALPELTRSRPGGLPDYQPPKGDMECKLAAIWADVLEIDEISRRDDFFELGGDSLALLQVAMDVQNQLNCQFFETDLLQATDLAGMAGLVSGFLESETQA
ncbi:non-ribosomal peptide synthetase [Rhodovibrionaceae bacterium A322]